MKTFLGVDCGTQSTKILIYNPQSRKVVARGQAPHALLSDNAGKREQKAEWWIQALKKALAGVRADVRRSVAAVGVSGQQHGFVPLGEGGEVLHPVKLWCDTSTAEECAEITARYGGPKKLLENVGNLVLPGYTISKVLWLKKRQPALYARLRTILLPHDYLNYWLTGKASMEYGDASGTGFLNVRSRGWATDLIRVLDDERRFLALLPPFVEPGEPAGTLTAQAAKALGLKAGILVSNGGGDNMMGAIGTGTNTDGSLTMSLGTSGTLYGYSSRPIVDPDGNLAAFCSSTGGWLPLLCTMNCTVATELTRSLLDFDLREMERVAGKARPGCDEVLMLPFFNGERTPNLPRGRGCVVGLTPSNYTRENTLRSAMESAVYGLKLGLESFTKLGFKPRELKLIGGGSKSRLWRQMVADIFELPVVCPEEEEAAAFGASLQALWCWRNHESRKTDLNAVLEEHVVFSKDKRHRPAGQNARMYQNAYDRYKEYVGVVTPIFS
jgi:xylulokinase